MRNGGRGSRKSGAALHAESRYRKETGTVPVNHAGRNAVKNTVALNLRTGSSALKTTYATYVGAMISLTERMSATYAISVSLRIFRRQGTGREGRSRLSHG